MEKLIIIRGPSGAGKSTVSKVLLKRATRPTMLVSQDQIRKLFNDHRKPAHQVSKELTAQAVLTGLKYGYDVVFEGIIGVERDLQKLQKIMRAHPTENYFFYLDVGYDETLRRHQTRPEKEEFGADAMKKWWDYASPMGHTSETIIPETSSLEETLRTIARVAGLKLQKPALNKNR